MTNLLRQKSLKCVEWTVETPSRSVESRVSRSFSFQDRKCFLKCSMENCSFGDQKFHLYFKSDGELQLPIKLTVCVSSDGSETLNAKVVSITRTNKEIWNYSSINLIYLLSFQVILHGDISQVDKSLQISSYKDAGCLADSLSHDFGKLFDKGPDHDVEFTCGDQTIKAHKNIICCRSKVFISMFQSDMVESKTGNVNIQDMDATIFQQFLRCLYTGKLPELTVEVAFQFYEVSDKYGVEAVKKQCTDFLTDNLTPENACEMLVLSDLHSDADFKKNVIQYIIEKKIPYVGQKWADFCEGNPILAVEVYKLFCEQFRSKKVLSRFNEMN